MTQEGKAISGPGTVPEGYLGAEGRIASGPAPELVAAGYALELADAPLLHRGLGLADLAHAVALTEAGVIPLADAARLLRVLLELLDTPADAFPYDQRYGDAYNSRERELERRLGAVAGWLPTGRTRREAGRIAFRLAARDRLLDLHAAVAAFVAALADRAEEQAATVWADTTYLQPAQPSTFGHYLGSFAEEGLRHLERVRRVHAWADTSPAGAGGVGGTRVPLDRARLAALLGFGSVGGHTRDAMWAADGLADAVVAAAQAAITVDRLAEDLEVFASPPFGYVQLDPSLCRASVLMPQKRNPYALAVVRGGAGSLVGRVAGILAMQRTPSARTDNWLYAYGEVAGALELAQRLVALGAAVVRGLQVDRAALAAAAAGGFTTATDLAEELSSGHRLDYRSAYRAVARAVAHAIGAGEDTLTPSGLARAAEQVLSRPLEVTPAALAAALDPATAVTARTQAGGAHPDRVREHAHAVHAAVAVARRWQEDRRAAAQEAVARLRDLARRHAEASDEDGGVPGG
jgi:argininosuccinate lyase